MHSDDNLDGLAEDLKSADISKLTEIVRQAEMFLVAQLQAGIAADQRAVTFSSVISAVVAVLLAGLITVVSDEQYPLVLGIVLALTTLGLLVALMFAVFAGRPTDWTYAGSNPRHWRAEVVAKEPLTAGLAGQAYLYAQGIVKNRDVLALNAKLMTIALAVAGCSLAIGFLFSLGWFVCALASAPSA